MSQKAESLFVFSKDELVAINANNLGDLLRNSPFFHSTFSGIHTNLQSGGFDANMISITMDGRPFMMHQNIPISFNSISLTNIEYVSISIANQDGPIKNNPGIWIDLVSKKLADESLVLNGLVSTSGLGDLTTSIGAQVSNKKHSLALQLTRNYQNSIKLEEQKRFTPWSANLNHSIQAQYKWYVLPGIEWQIQSNNNWLNAMHLNNVIEGTSRVKDQNDKLTNSYTSSIISANLSKQHRFELEAALHSFSHVKTQMDKDLHSLKEAKSVNQHPLDSVRYLYSFARAQLVGESKDLHYKIGLETSSQEDRINRNINALRTVYTDYSVFGNAVYSYKKIAQAGAGIRFLTNNTTGNFILPNASIAIAPEGTVSFRSNISTSVLYPGFEKIFYPSSITTTSAENNLIIDPARTTSINGQFTLRKDNLKLETGLLYYRIADQPRLVDGKWENAARSSGTSTFFSLSLSQGESMIKPIFVLHGMNNLVDSSGLSFFYPELNVVAKTKVKQTGTNLFLTSRMVGNFSRLFLIDGETVQDETDAYTLLNLSASQRFYKDIIQLTIGINNILDNSVLSNTRYLILELNKSEQNQTPILVDRGRNVFVSLSFQLP